MSMPGSEKHVSNVLVCHSSNKFEHLPIKKRRFLHRSVSPPPQNPSLANEQRSVPLKSDLGTLGVDKAAVQANIRSVEDFSGISMLADAACPNSFEREYGDAEDGSGIEEPFLNEGPVEVSTNSESQSFSKGLVKEPVNASDISVGGALSCVAAALAGEHATISTDCTSVKDPFHEDSKQTVSSDVSSMRDEDPVGSQKLQYRDDRLHWDLNEVMDVWEEPSDFENSHISDCVAQGSGIVAGCSVNRNSAENHDMLSEPESSLCDDEKKLLHHEPGKSLDQTSQGNTGNQDCHINHKSHNPSAGMYNTSVPSDKYKSVPSSLGDGNFSVQPLVSKNVNEIPPVLTAITEPTDKSIDFTPLFRDQKNLTVPDRSHALVSVGDAVMRNTSISVSNIEVKFTARPPFVIDDELTLKPLMPSKPFDERRRNMKSDANDSQYEDGELVLEENEAINEKTEDFDNVNADKTSYIATATDHHYSESELFRRMNRGVISSAGEIAHEFCLEPDRPTTDDNDYEKDDSMLKLVHTRDEKMGGPASSEMIESNKLSSATEVRARDDCEGTGMISNLANNTPDSAVTDPRVGYRRGFMSQSNGLVSHDVYFREEQDGNRSKLGYSYMKYPERAVYSRQTQSRVHNGNNWNGSSDSHRGFRHNYLPTYPTLVRTSDEDGTEGKEDRDGRLNTASYLSHDESIADLAVAGNFQPHHKRNEGLGSGRTVNRGSFQRYDRHMDHGAERGRFHRHPPAQMDKSFSPNGRRGYQFVHQSRSRSPSRSRTRSPEPRGSPYLRRTSRSPNFRSEARMTQLRSPHQQRFRAFQRDHMSPPPPRWISNRKEEPDRFNYNRNPPNTGRFPDSARNTKPDVHYRQNKGRFSEMEGNGRPHRLEENFEYRRHFGIANRLRRDNDDGFVPRNRDVADFHPRRNDNRNEDMPRSFRRDGKFSSNSKEFGFCRTDSSRNVDSGEPYRPIYPGRCNELNERRHYNNDVYLPRRGSADDSRPTSQISCDMPISQRQDQHFDSSEQEKKLGQASESIDLQAPAEK